MTNKPTTELVKLDGTMIKSDGSQIKTNFFKCLEIDLDQYSDITYTPEEAHKIRSQMMKLSTGASAAIPIICPGEVKCPFAHSCPLVKTDRERREQLQANIARLKAADPEIKLEEEDTKIESVLPVGRRCLVEVNLLSMWSKWYINEFDVQESAFVDIQMCQELAEIELMIWRLNNNLAKPEHAELTQLTTIGVDREGNPLTRREENALILAKERLNNRKTRIVKMLVGDRQEQYKREAALKEKKEPDASTNAAKLRGRIVTMLKEAEKTALKLHELEGNVIDVEVEEKKYSPEALIDEELSKGE